MRKDKETLDARTLVQHPEYIRTRINEEYMNTLADVLKDNKDQWPFPPIHVQPIPVSEEKLIKEGKRYYILDGTHRSAAALKRNAPVSAVVHSGLAPVEAISMQVSENVKNGMALDTKARKMAIDALRKLGLNQKDIAGRTGLTQSTVSRIWTGTAGVVAGTDADKRKGKKVKGKGKDKPFDLDAWLKLLGKVLAGWDTHRRKIEKKGFPDKMGKALDTIAELLEEAE